MNTVPVWRWEASFEQLITYSSEYKKDNMIEYQNAWSVLKAQQCASLLYWVSCLIVAEYIDEPDVHITSCALFIKTSLKIKIYFKLNKVLPIYKRRMR